MSPEAIERRLRDLAQLYRLGKSIEGSQKLGKVSNLESDASDESVVDSVSK